MASGENPSFTGDFIGETHWVLECTQAHPPGNQHQKGQICLWVVEEVIESGATIEQVALYPLGPVPHIQCQNPAIWVALS